MKYWVNCNCRTSGHLLATAREEHGQDQEALDCSRRCPGNLHVISKGKALHKPSSILQKCPRETLAQGHFIQSDNSLPTPSQRLSRPYPSKQHCLPEDVKSRSLQA